MSETDPYYEDDATEIASVLQTFKQINENIKTLNGNLNESTKTLGDLVKSEYAGELARLRERVEGLTQSQAGIKETIDEHQEKVQDLYDAARSLEGQDTKLAGVTRDLEAHGRKINGIVARPAARAEQEANLRMRAAIGFLSCLLLVFCGLWALPDRAETGVARMIMGADYWDAAWRMMEVHSQSELERFAVLNDIDTADGRLEQLQICRDQARKSGEPQECVVVFSP